MENNNLENMPVEETVEAPAEEVVSEQPAAVKKANAFLDKIKAKANALIDLFKADRKQFFIKVGSVALAVVLAVTAILVTFSLLTNTKKTPLQIEKKYMNKKRGYNPLTAQAEMLNGFTEKEWKQIYKIMSKSDEYADYIDEFKENHADNVEDMKDEYGRNYKYTYKITDSEKLEKEDLRAFRKQIRSAAKSLDSFIEETEDYDFDDWSDAADETGLSRKQLKKVVKLLKKIEKKWSKAKVTKGYELEVTVKLTGKELDEPEEHETTVRVYKVNGRWISEDALYQEFVEYSSSNYNDYDYEDYDYEDDYYDDYDY